MRYKTPDGGDKVREAILTVPVDVMVMPPEETVTSSDNAGIFGFQFPAVNQFLSPAVPVQLTAAACNVPETNAERMKIISNIFFMFLSLKKLFSSVTLFFN